ncbi:IclR family transcriptional regulator C-terminal domain-containing protein [Actinosynnema sp. NPDC047251]|uniref:Glycerol operon regulatory protein n=1 Tax=Saccharothrix espanaensis (strain ATCC 51144 / DSM 44229 / JCM 9112 / NBRC 15066 / NRRL 15764) TaxID=1179773 RepID=K0K2Z2_SACES|nr:IclR family transcriptional regulator C-terminal domain-containing protein [Saccharothrix espanaensis]CCH31962.1 Transcriptional regulator, IclR family [Saccharothrix espanaensis DSM 44229]
MPRDDAGPDFIEALARGLDVLKCFGTRPAPLSLTEIATATGLARPTTRRIVLTLEHLGYVRSTPDGVTLTPRVLELGVAYTLSTGLWEVARPHLTALVEQTDQAASIAQLDGSDILYVARVEAPKVVSVNVTVGTRFPAAGTALGKVLLAALAADDLRAALATPGRSTVRPRRTRSDAELEAELREVRARGWASTDEEVALGVRAVAAPLRDGDGRITAAVNIAAITAEVGHRELIEDLLPLLLRTAGAIGRDFDLVHAAPQRVVRRAQPGGSPRQAARSSSATPS